MNVLRVFDRVGCGKKFHPNLTLESNKQNNFCANQKIISLSNTISNDSDIDQHGLSYPSNSAGKIEALKIAIRLRDKLSSVVRLIINLRAFFTCLILNQS